MTAAPTDRSPPPRCSGAPGGGTTRRSAPGGSGGPEAGAPPVRFATVRKLAVLSLHTSPLAQPGTGDGGGMNVYVRELSAALARSGVHCDVYTRSPSSSTEPTVRVEPGLVVHHVPAGPPGQVDKGELHRLVGEFADGVAARMAALEAAGEPPAEAIHANYWLSGMAGHLLKHRLDLPLVSTFHTLDRVKAEASPEDLDREDPDRRARGEAEVIGCSDAVLASCSVEAEQLIELYGAEQTRVVVVPPGVDGAFFSPGDRHQARRALRLDPERPLVLFVGRIQPLKGARGGAAEPRPPARARRRRTPASPSSAVRAGREGGRSSELLKGLAGALGLPDAVSFVAPQPHELLSSWYRAADCCVVPSRSESFGLVALEAGACGMPVVASAVGGLTTLVEEGRTGFLVEAGDVAGFADRLARLLARPAPGRRDGRRGGRPGPPLHLAPGRGSAARRSTRSSPPGRSCPAAERAGAGEAGPPGSRRDRRKLASGDAKARRPRGRSDGRARSPSGWCARLGPPRRDRDGRARSARPGAVRGAVPGARRRGGAGGRRRARAGGEAPRRRGRLPLPSGRWLRAGPLGRCRGSPWSASSRGSGPGSRWSAPCRTRPRSSGRGQPRSPGGSSAGEGDLEWAESILSAIGVVVRLPEHLLDVATGLSGSGPAYVFLVAEALTEAGVLLGLDREVAKVLTVQTLLGSARMLAESGESAEVLRAAVTSPGGTTAAGLRVLEERAVRAALLAAVETSAERARAIGQA